MTDAEIAVETAKFIPTGKTVVHRGRTFDILNPPADEHRAESPYILKSKRGAWFALMRNKPRPEIMFGVALYGKLTCLPGWFTDKTGELASLG
jgi:hypothetical protein